MPISTPVTPVVRTSAATRKPGSASSGSIVTATLASGSGWHSGTRSAVRLAAMIPASSAVRTTSPLGASPASVAASVAGWQVSVPCARAIRRVDALSDTSTIVARPSLPICVRPFILQPQRARAAWSSPSGSIQRLPSGPSSHFHNTASVLSRSIR